MTYRGGRPPGPRYEEEGDGVGVGFSWFGLAIVAVVAALLVGGGILLFAFRSVDAGQVALRFGGGAFDTRNGQYKAVHGPGRSNMGLLDRVFPYPTTVRNEVFAADPDGQGPKLGGDAPPVPCATKTTDPGSGTAGPRVDLQGQFLFFLNTGPELGAFHARYGVRYHAWEHFDDDVRDDGWPKMLNETFRPIAESVLVAACRDFTVDDLSRQDKIDALEATVGQRVTALLHDRMRGPYFCGTGFDRDHPEGCTTTATVAGPGGRSFTGFASPIVFQLKPVLPPKSLTDAAERLTVAQRNLAAATVEAQAIAKAREQGLTGMAWVANECLKQPACRDSMTFVAGDATVTTPGRAR